MISLAGFLFYNIKMYVQFEDSSQFTSLPLTLNFFSLLQ